MINRAALLLRYKQPAVDWINEVDPAQTKQETTLEEVNEERTVYLIGESVADSSDKLHRWLRRNFAQLFEMELEAWYTDPALWPSSRTYKMFQDWFTVECNTVLVDLVGTAIYDDET
jgi:hypothetical protein